MSKTITSPTHSNCSNYNNSASSHSGGTPVPTSGSGGDHHQQQSHSDLSDSDDESRQHQGGGGSAAIQHEILKEITDHIDTLVHLSQSEEVLRDSCVKFQLEHAAANAAYSLELESCGKKRIQPPASLVDSHMKGALERMADFCASVSKRVLARTIELSCNPNTAKLMGASTSSNPAGGASTASNRSCSPPEAFNSDSIPTSLNNNTHPNVNFIVAGGIEESNKPQAPSTTTTSNGTKEQQQSPQQDGHTGGCFPPAESYDSMCQPTTSGGGGMGASWARSCSVDELHEGTAAWIEVGANAMHASVTALNLLPRAHTKLDKALKEYLINHSSIKVLDYVADALAIPRDVELHCFAEGYRTMHISLIANLTHDCPLACKLSGQSTKLLSAILTCTRLDEENPGCAEWAEYCIRNICVHSPEAREFIKHLKLSVKSPGAALAAASASGSLSQSQQHQLARASAQASSIANENSDSPSNSSNRSSSA